MLQGIYQLTSIGLAITKRTRYYPVATGIAAVASVTANVLLIPHFGVLGAAWANMISYGVLAAVATWFSQRFYPISYEWGRLARIVVGGAPLISRRLPSCQACCLPSGAFSSEVAWWWRSTLPSCT